MLTQDEVKGMVDQTRADYSPMKVTRAADRITVAAPMPGLQPDDILVEVTASGRLALHGLWGASGGDEDGETIVDEWEPGPYHRELDLPAPVDGERAELTYRDGVLVLTLPVTDRTRPARLTLRTSGPGGSGRSAAVVVERTRGGRA